MNLELEIGTLRLVSGLICTRKNYHLMSSTTTFMVYTVM